MNFSYQLYYEEWLWYLCFGGVGDDGGDKNCKGKCDVPPCAGCEWSLSPCYLPQAEAFRGE